MLTMTEGFKPLAIAQQFIVVDHFAGEDPNIG